MLDTTLPLELQNEASIPELEAFSKKAGNALKTFLSAESFDLKKYKLFLNTMYHYTSRSGEMIKHGENIAGDAELKKFFGFMLSEEKGHYLLAKEDLKGLGEEVSKEAPQSVKAFHEQWFNLSNSVFSYLGAIYVFENIAKHVQMEGKAMFDKLGLTNKQRRWLAVHLEADLKHGDEIIEVASHYFKQDPDAFLKGGEVMCDCWIRVFTDLEEV